MFILCVFQRSEGILFKLIVFWADLTFPQNFVVTFCGEDGSLETWFELKLMKGQVNGKWMKVHLILEKCSLTRMCLSVSPFVCVCVFG